MVMTEKVILFPEILTLFYKEPIHINVCITELFLMLGTGDNVGR